MKRSGFKNKPRKPLKRTPLRKVSPNKVKTKKPRIGLLKKKLWELCKQIIRTRDGSICFICGKSGLEGSGWHTGHFIPSASCGAFLRYDLRNLHSSCYNCNINLGGNGAEFYRRIVEVYGSDFGEQIFKDKQISIKADILFYEEKIKEYKEISSWNKNKLFDYTRVYRGKPIPESDV